MLDELFSPSQTEEIVSDHSYIVIGTGDRSLREALAILGLQDATLPKQAVDIGRVGVKFTTGHVYRYEGPTGKWSLVFKPEGNATGVIAGLNAISGVEARRDSALS